MTKDVYLIDENCVNRLVTEWRKYDKIIIAVDFDDTVFDFHGAGHTYGYVLELIRRCQKIGCYTMVLTANDDPARHEFIREYLNTRGIQVDVINDNLPHVPFKTRKPYYNVLLDDRSGLKSAYNQLSSAVSIMEMIKGNE
jgi:hypothetical protein